jgi:hypothetical protein
MEHTALERLVNTISKKHRLGKPQRADAIEILLEYIDIQEYKLNRLYGTLQDIQTIPVDRLPEIPRRITGTVKKVNGW